MSDQDRLPSRFGQWETDIVSRKNVPAITGQLELFAAPGVEYIDPLLESAIDMLQKATSEQEIDGRQVKMVSLRPLWEWLDKPYSDFNSWWREKKSNHKLKKGKDFILLNATNSTQKKGRGRKAQDFFVMPEKAKAIFAKDESKKAQALVQALFKLAEDFRAGDKGMLLDLIDRQTDLEFLASIPERCWRREAQENLNRGMPLAQVMEWYRNRVDGIPIRKNLCGTAAERGMKDPRDFAALTNGPYIEITGMTAAELRTHHKCKDKETPRNHMRPTQLLEIALTESRSVEAIEEDNVQSPATCIEIARRAARGVVAGRLLKPIRK